jgi:probable HAF family extracellular repeat protein
VTGPNGNTITDLGTLGGSFSTGQALNAAGQVTGISRTAGDAFSHAFFYAGGSGIVDMGTLGGSFSEGMGLNDTGQVVGRASTAGDAQQHAFVSGVNGVGLFDLNWFVSLDAGRYLTEAVGINRWGQIVANDNAGHAFLLSPVPEPQSWAMVALGLVLVGGLRIKQQRRHAANQVS